MNFPEYISFTITNSCNLRCQMCGQWSEEGYIYNRTRSHGSQLKLSDWKKLVDEISAYKVKFILLRGGEPFLFPGIIDLVEYINSKGIFVSIDSNGTIIEKFIPDLIRIGNMHITFSVDGPEEIHDVVRGVNGSYKKIKENIALFNKLEKETGKTIGKSICFTISKFSYLGLGEMPDVVRDMGISSINIVPYYYFPAKTGEEYENELEENFNCTAFSWKGFHHEESGIDFEIFKEELQKYKSNLKDIVDFPYLPLSENEYKVWFSDSTTPIGTLDCMNIEKLIDIQPDGDANFCVDFPDYSFGNVKEASIKDIWNSNAAEQFRNYRRKNPLSVCYRCGAKYMSLIV